MKLSTSSVVRHSLLLACLAVPVRAQEPTPAPDAEVLDELRSAPATNPERVSRIEELYFQAGAPETAILLQPVKGRRPDDPLLHNVIVTKKGQTDDVIIVGGHLDKVSKGGGIIDDWSGSCMATNLYQAIKDVPTKHTFVFMGFAYEEQGLVGSRKYVESLDEAQRSKIKAMVNLECLGVGGPFLWTNGSSDELEKLAHEVSEATGLPLVDHVIQGVGADSMPFERVGIRVLTFDGLPLDKISLIHSDKDTYESLDPETYVTSYRLVTHYLLKLDQGVPAPIEPEPKAERKAEPAP